MAMYRLRNPVTGAEFNVSSPRRRDRFLRRGFALAGAPAPTAKPTPSTAELPYRDLQASAKRRGIPANQSRADLERAIADHSE